MKISSPILTLSMLIVVTSLFVPAQAQPPAQKNPMVNTTGLPQVKFHTTRLQMDIVDESPIIRDMRRRPEDGVNLDGLQVPGLPDSSHSGSVRGGAGAITGPSSGIAPAARSVNDMVPNLNSLPQSGFGSQPNARTGRMSPPASLPSGYSTGIHTHAKLQAPASCSVGDFVPSSRNPVPITARSHMAPVANYGDSYVRSGTVKSGSNGGAVTAVHGVVKNMLSRHN